MKAIDFRRRKFLLTAGIGGASAVAAVTGGTLMTTAPAERPATSPGTGSGYQATPHVRNYYRTARI